MIQLKLGFGLLLVGLLSACTTIDRNAAASLGTAGENATQALSAQTTSAGQTLGQLNQWWGVHDALVCTNIQVPAARSACLKSVETASDPALNKSVAQLSEVIAKRKQAIDTLNQAYAAFVDLSKYNAGQDATAALKTTFADVNSFVAAASALSPAAAAVAPISTTIEDAAGGALSIFADDQQNKLILAASKDLQTANDALYAGLILESGATTNLLVTLQSERDALYGSGLDAGIIAPTDVLTPVFSEAFPNIHLTAASAANRDAELLAAHMAVNAQTQTIVAAIPKSYTDALGTLHAVSAQHQKFDAQQTLNLTEIELEISNLQADVAQMNSKPQPPNK